MEPYCFQGYWWIAGKMTRHCDFECKNRSDHDQIWHAWADRSGNGSYLKKIDPQPQGGQSWNFRGSNNQKSGKCHELSRKAIKMSLTHPTPGDSGGLRGGGLGVNISKVREISWTAEKIDNFFYPHPPSNTPTKGGRSGNCRGSKNQKSGKCHELPRKVITKK